ncbi:MAG: class I SAM-dependent methyltransferase [Bacteroidales bacterium]|nr:class I SAM-dependent methyltransferase [Bacteroidales bacterium]
MTSDVREYYNKHMHDEDKRLDRHPFEIPVTMHYLKKYVKPGEKIFDVACGTGRIAEHLLERNYKVGLNDLSDANINKVKERFDKKEDVLFTDRADALESKGWAAESWDCIFILGPLYHMISKEKRLKLLKLAYNNLKPGGFVFSSFMTRTGALIYGLKHNPEGINFPDGAKKLWETGTDDKFVEATEWFTNAYFAHPEEVNPLIECAGLKPLHLAGAEGPFGERFELYHELQPDLQKKWMKFVIDHAEDTHFIHLAKHLLSVAQKP